MWQLTRHFSFDEVLLNVMGIYRCGGNCSGLQSSVFGVLLAIVIYQCGGSSSSILICTGVGETTPVAELLVGVRCTVLSYRLVLVLMM